jgi:ubiquinone biosynthesis protein
LRQILLALSARDPEWLAEVYIDMGVASATVDRAAFARDLGQSLGAFYAAAERAASFGEILHQFIRLGRRHQIRMPREFLLVTKAFMIVEAQARSLDPEFNMLAAMRAYIPAMLSRQLLPDFSLEGQIGSYRAAAAVLAMVRELPQALNAGLRRLQRGEAVLRIRHEQLEGLQEHIDRGANRLSFSLIIAAILVGSSLIMAFHVGPHYRDVPLLGLFGYVIAAVLGLGWALTVLRSGKF